MSPEKPTRDLPSPEPASGEHDLLAIFAVALVLAAVALVLPVAATLVGGGRLPNAPAGKLAAGTIQLVIDGRWRDPASAYPPHVRAQMPEAATWWLVAGGTLLTILAIGAVAFRRLEPVLARERLGRRPHDPRGSRPRPWALPRDLRALASNNANRGGFSLGTLAKRKLRADPETHVALIAPTRAGKTSRLVIPWLFEHDGPAIVTSTKRDILQVTAHWRARHGAVYIFDPFSPGSCGWNPLHGCEHWETCLQQSSWLTDATQEGNSEIASYWRGEAAKLLAPLLGAAALGELEIDAVLGWLDQNNAKEPLEILDNANAGAAYHQLEAVTRLDDRNRGTTYMSAGSVLAAYRYPRVQQTASPGDLTAEGFFDGRPNTLYLVSADRHQRLLTPLIVAILSSLLHHRAETRTSTPATRLRVLIDEAANIAPLRDLPRILSQAAGHDIQIATVWQTIAQLQDGYGRGAETILANSATQIFLGPINDPATRSLLIDTLEPRRAGDASGDSPATTGALRQLTRDRALLLTAGTPPAITHLRAWWRRPAMRRRAHGDRPRP